MGAGSDGFCDPARWPSVGAKGDLVGSSLDPDLYVRSKAGQRGVPLLGAYKHLEFFGSKAKLLSVEIEPCDTEPCVFKRGNTTSIRFSIDLSMCFTAPRADQDSDTATLDARMKVFGFMVAIPGVAKDLCKYAIQCPIVKGNTYHGLNGCVRATLDTVG
ncbi:hypothetical protein MTO96_001001 [Rhipicephalus appendiculatus]